jgi:predicted peptidase
MILTRTRTALLLSLLAFGIAPAGAQTPATGFLDRSLVLGGDVYRYQVYVPADYSRTFRWPVVLFLHGAGERGTDGLLQTEVGIGSAIRRHADRVRAIVVMPQAWPGRTWSGTMADVAMRALEKTEGEFGTDPERVYLTGLSLGGAGTWYLGYRYPERFAALLAVCARVRPGQTTTDPIVPASAGEPFAALAARIKSVPIWIVHGDADPTVPVEESRGIVAALEAIGADVHYQELPGVGHNAWDTAYRSEDTIAWLLAQRRPAP